MAAAVIGIRGITTAGTLDTTMGGAATGVAIARASRTNAFASGHRKTGVFAMRYAIALLMMSALIGGCASTMSARQAADYNGDGAISDAEYKQFNKQAAVQERNVYTESVKRRGAVNTVHDVNESVWTVRSILSGIRSF
jgi:uncharacterized protein YceK